MFRCRAFRRISLRVLVYFLLCGAAQVPTAALADWPVNGRPVSTNRAVDFSPHVVSDGVGGIFAAWWSQDTYAQHITGQGDYAESWPGAGLFVPPEGRNWLDHYEIFPSAIVPDGGRGVYIVLWAGLTCTAECGGTPGQFYVQHLTNAGTVSPGWPQGVVRAENWFMDYYYYSRVHTPTAMADGENGILVGWATSYYPAPHPTIGIQSIGPDGTARWGDNGLTLAQVYADLTDPAMIPDGEGGAFVFWGATRSQGEGMRIYGQHVSAAGEPLWQTNGLPISESSYVGIGQPVVVSDGAHGAIVAWSGSHGAGFNVYAVHVELGSQREREGAPPGKPTEHETGAGRMGSAHGGGPSSREDLTVCAAPGDQTEVRIVALRQGGAIVAWLDSRQAGIVGIYAQRLTNNGSRRWQADGMPVCTAPGTRSLPALASDGADGAFVAWADSRPANELYALHMSGEGTATLGWPLDGAVVCARPTASYSTGGVESLEMTAVPDGRAIVLWSDFRTPPDNKGDADFAFAMLLTPEGPAATPATAALTASNAAVMPCRPASLAQPGLSLRTNISGSASNNGVVQFSLPSAAHASLDLFDLTGRRLWSREVGGLGPGDHEARLGDGERFASGIYMVRLTQGGHTTAARIALIR